jgi:hypothetical protein
MFGRLEGLRIKKRGLGACFSNKSKKTGGGRESWKDRHYSCMHDFSRSVDYSCTTLIRLPCALANWGSSSWKGPLAVWGAISAMYGVCTRNYFPPKSCAGPPEGSSSWKIHLAKGPFSLVRLYLMAEKNYVFDLIITYWIVLSLLMSLFASFR